MKSGVKPPHSTRREKAMQYKISRKKLISLGIYFVLSDLVALVVVVYFISYPNDCLKKVAMTSGFVISSNQYQAAAHKIADAIKNRKIPGGQILLVGVIVDQNGKVYAVDADRNEVLIDENPQTEPKTELWGGVNLTNLPGNSVFGMLTLTEGENEMVGQSAMLYQRK